MLGSFSGCGISLILSFDNSFLTLIFDSDNFSNQDWIRIFFVSVKLSSNEGFNTLLCLFD